MTPFLCGRQDCKPGACARCAWPDEPPTDIVQRLRTTGSVRSWSRAEALMSDAADEIERLRADAARYAWLRDNPLWSVSYRIKPRSKTKDWRMRNEGDYWGEWWPTHEQAIDHAMKGLT